MLLLEKINVALPPQLTTLIKSQLSLIDLISVAKKLARTVENGNEIEIAET